MFHSPSSPCLTLVRKSVSRTQEEANHDPLFIWIAIARYCDAHIQPALPRESSRFLSRFLHFTCFLTHFHLWLLECTDSRIHARSRCLCFCTRRYIQRGTFLCLTKSSLLNPCERKNQRSVCISLSQGTGIS